MTRNVKFSPRGVGKNRGLRKDYPTKQSSRPQTWVPHGTCKQKLQWVAAAVTVATLAPVYSADWRQCDWLTALFIVEGHDDWSIIALGIKCDIINSSWKSFKRSKWHKGGDTALKYVCKKHHGSRLKWPVTCKTREYGVQRIWWAVVDICGSIMTIFASQNCHSNLALRPCLL